MRFGTVTVHGESKVVLVEEGNKRILLLQAAAQMMKAEFIIPDTLQACITEGESFVRNAEKIERWASSQAGQFGLYHDDFVWEAPIPHPSKNIFCVGKNYAEHAIELGSAADIPEHVMIFTKAPTTVIGCEAIIPLHEDVTDQLDYEGELAVVIGKKGTKIKREDALDYVFGYTILNDITARDLQAKHKQFFLGKSLDGSCPIGPVIVEKSTINPNKLTIQTKVNGEIRQNANTEQLIFPIADIISVLSKGMTLEPGDIIATGTPAGVGKGFKPPLFLRKGDKIDITIEDIGTLTNIVH